MTFEVFTTVSIKTIVLWVIVYSGWLLTVTVIFCPEDKGTMFLWRSDNHLPDYTVSNTG